MAKDTTEYRFPVFLKEEDWQYLIRAWEARRRRIRAKATWERYNAVNRIVSDATADAYLDKDEMKYVLYITQDDFRYLEESLRFHPKKGRDLEAAERVNREIRASYGDMRPA